MKCSINMINDENLFYTWNKKNNIYWISNVEQSIDKLDTKESVLDFLHNETSNISIIFEDSEYILACVDTVRAFPIFYKIDVNNEVIITNKIPTIEKHCYINIDFFLHNFCTENEQTLAKDWKQLCAGEYLLINKHINKIDIKQYYQFANNGVQRFKNEDELFTYLIEKTEKIISENKDKTFVIPLSGGYDSRAILCMLKEVGAKNILTYTYGNINSEEKNTAQKVAKQLGMDWHFIEYDEKLLELFFSEHWKQYAYCNHHYTSLPHEQDFFALYALQAQDIIPSNAIFLPGFLGDYLAGSMYKDAYSLKQYSKVIDENYLIWYMQNRASKFIVNAVRCFEYFGYSWHLFWHDKLIMDYFFSTFNKNTSTKYEDFLMQYIFKKHKVDFYKSKPSKIKNQIKQLLPDDIVKLYQKYNSKRTINDPINSNILSKKISRFDKECIGENFNQIHAKYFLKLIKYI